MSADLFQVVLLLTGTPGAGEAVEFIRFDEGSIALLAADDPRSLAALKIVAAGVS